MIYFVILVGGFWCGIFLEVIGGGSFVVVIEGIVGVGMFELLGGVIGLFLMMECILNLV